MLTRIGDGSKENSEACSTTVRGTVLGLLIH